MDEPGACATEGVCSIYVTRVQAAHAHSSDTHGEGEGPGKAAVYSCVRRHFAIRYLKRHPL